MRVSRDGGTGNNEISRAVSGEAVIERIWMASET
jgi:hypothetical protein